MQGKKKTHEQFVEELNIINPNIGVLEEYVNALTNILCKCKIDGYEWKATPNNLLNKQSGCSRCSNNEKYTTDSFKEKLFVISPNIELLSQYTNNGTNILCKCKIDGYEWKATPNNLLNKQSGCPKCSNKEKYTTDSFINKMKEINPNIEILGKYTNSYSKILCKCKIDGYEWKATPEKLFIKQSCPRCAKNERYTHEQYIQMISYINDNIEILDKCENSKTKIKCKCKIDGYEWETTPNNLIHGKTGCSRCENKEKWTHESFINKMQEINSNIKIIGKFINIKTKIECKCKVCKNKWFVSSISLIHNKSGCPKCKAHKTEREIIKILEKYKIFFEHEKKFNDCRDKGLLRFDFYLPDYNICIEYDGEQHYMPVKFNGIDLLRATKIFNDCQKRDVIKTNYCKNNNIKLIRIPYWEKKTLENFLLKTLKSQIFLIAP